MSLVSSCQSSFAGWLNQVLFSKQVFWVLFLSNQLRIAKMWLIWSYQFLHIFPFNLI